MLHFCSIVPVKGESEGMCSRRPEENFKIYPSNGAIWCTFSLFPFLLKTSVYFFARNLDTVSAFERGNLVGHIPSGVTKTQKNIRFKVYTLANPRSGVMRRDVGHTPRMEVFVFSV